MRERPGERDQGPAGRLERIQRPVAGDVIGTPLGKDIGGHILQVLDREGAVQQVAARRGGVTGRHHPVVRDGPLDEDVPLGRAAVLQVTIEARLANPVDLGCRRIAADRRRERRRIREADNRYAVRIEPIRQLQDTAREIRRPVVRRAGEVAGIARQVGHAKAGADHRALVQ